MPWVPLIWVLLIWTLTHQLSMLTSDLPGGPWATSGPCSPHQTWSWPWLEDWPMCLTSDLLHHHVLAWWPGLWAALPPLPALLPDWGWWDRPWLARSSPAGHSIPLSSWLPSLTEQLALMSPRKNPTCECIQDTKMISKKNFGLHLPQVISRAYLSTFNSIEDPRTQGCTEFPIRQSPHPPAYPSPSPE